MEKESVYSKPVTLKNILKFAVPTIAMSLFMSFYTMVDGLFVSDRHQRIIGHQSDGTCDPVCHCCLDHACHWWQRRYHEKDGRAQAG